MFKVDYKNTRTTSMTPFWYFFFLTFYIFHTTDNHYTKALLETPSLSYVSVCACNEVILVSISEIAKKLETVYHPKTHLKFSGKCNAMNKN